MAFDLSPDLWDFERRLALRNPAHIRYDDCRRDELCWKAADDREPPEPPEPPEPQVVAAALRAIGSSSFTPRTDDPDERKAT